MQDCPESQAGEDLKAYKDTQRNLSLPTSIHRELFQAWISPILEVSRSFPLQFKWEKVMQPNPANC